MIKRLLTQWWLAFQIRWWTRGKESNRRFYHRCYHMITMDDIEDERPLVRKTIQGLNEVEFDADADVIFENGRPAWLNEALKTGRPEEKV